MCSLRDSLMFALAWAIGACTATAGVWIPESSTVGEDAQLCGIVACSDQVGWAVGDSGIVLKREDSQWRLIDNLPLAEHEWDFIAVDATGDGVVWIVGEKRGAPSCHNGVVIVTSDGGETWRAVHPALPHGSEPTPFRDVHLCDASLCWVAGGNGLVFQTRDGGRSWRVSEAYEFSHHVTCIWGEGADRAWACSDNSGGVAKTGDGGATWETSEPFAAEYNLPEIDPGQRYSRNAAGLWAAAFDTAHVALSEGIIGSTTDGGTSWNVRAIAPERVWFRSVWGKGRFLWAVGTSGEIYYSDTQGELWAREYGGADFHLNDVDMLDDLSGYGWAVGTNGTILRRIPKAFPDLSFETNSPAPFTDIVWMINPQAPVDSFQLYRNFENEHQDLSGYMVTLDFIESLGRYSYTDFHEYGGPHRYYYWVKTFYGDGSCDLRGPLAVGARGAAIPGFPPSPDHLTADRTPNGVLLTWGPIGTHTYRVYRSEPSSGPFQCIGETNQSHYLDDEVDETATYFYLLRTAGSELTSPDSPLASVGPQGHSYDVTTEVDPLGTYYDVANRTAYFSWIPVSDFSLGGYWVSVNDTAAGRELRNTSPLSRNWYGMRHRHSVPASKRLKCGVLPMDRISRTGIWHDCELPIGLCNTYRDDATAGNNARRLVEADGSLHLLYSDVADGERRIYYVHSGNGCVAWSEPVEIGRGVFPALASNSKGLFGVWLDESWERIVCARYSGGFWQTETMFESADWLSPLSFAADDDAGYLATVMRDSVCVGAFSLSHPAAPEWQRISSEPVTSPLCRASIDLDGCGFRHVAYSSSDGDIYYWSDYTSPASINISNSPWNSRLPALDAEGLTVRVVWEEEQSGHWKPKCWQLFDARDTSLWDLSCVSEPGPGGSSLQPTIRGNRVLWMGENEGPGERTPFEIYGSRFRHDSTFAWEVPENWSNLSWACSGYPQVHVSGTWTYGVWTEGVPPHAWIRLEDRNLTRDDVAFYKLGGQMESSITVTRDGFIRYGDRAYRRVDYSDASLVYRIDGFEPDSSYWIGLGFYQEDEVISRQAIDLDGEKMKTVDVPLGEVVYLQEDLPRSATCDGTVEFSIANLFDGKATLSYVSLGYDASGGGGPQSALSREGFEQSRISIEVMPSPFAQSAVVHVDGVDAGGNCPVAIYDIAGRLVKKLPLSGLRTEWDGSDGVGQQVAAGIYFMRLEARGQTVQTKTLKLR